MNFARTIYSNHTQVLPRLRFHARLRDASFCRSPIYHIVLSDRLLRAAAAEYTPHVQYLIEYYLQARVQVRKLREFNSAGAIPLDPLRAARGRGNGGAGTPDIN